MRRSRDTSIGLPGGVTSIANPLWEEEVQFMNISPIKKFYSKDLNALSRIWKYSFLSSMPHWDQWRQCITLKWDNP